jgi:methylthioribulose-1-phosphate dehydratase
MSIEHAPSLPVLAEWSDDVERLREVGRYFHCRGWSVGTSSNYSVVIGRAPLELIVTASGKDKGKLTSEDFVRIGPDGAPLYPGQPKSSAETLLHVVAAAQEGVGAVLHTHSIWATLLSEWFHEQGYVEISGFEMLKGLSGITTHDTTIRIPIFDNTQDIPVLADEVQRRMSDVQSPLKHAYLIHQHGTYTWGQDVDEAVRHIEILEFLFECVGRQWMMTRGNGC